MKESPPVQEVLETSTCFKEPKIVSKVIELVCIQTGTREEDMTSHWFEVEEHIIKAHAILSMVCKIY